MANILLITYFFPPINSAGSQCAYLLAKYLKKLGHNLIILTSETIGEDKEKNLDIDLSYLKIYRKRFLDIRFLVKRIFNIRQPLNESLVSLDKNKVCCFSSDKILSIYNSFFHERGILFGVARFPSFADLWFFSAYKEARRIIRKENIDIIITRSLPNVAHLIGLFLKRKFKDLLWIAHFEDLWTQNPWQKGCFPFTAFEEFLERKCIKKADIITIVSKVWMQWLKDKYSYKSSRIFCIENGFDEDLLSNIVPYKSITSNVKKTMIYTGTLYENRGDVEPLFKAINSNCSFFEDRIEIVFYGGLLTRNILFKFLHKYPSTKEIIKYGGFLSKKDTFDKQNNADILFFVEKDSKNDGMLTSKIYEYIMFMKPILCIGIKPNTYIGKFLSKTGLCIFCGDDIMNVEENLRLIIEGKIRFSPDEDYIKTLSSKNQIGKLNKIIGEYLNKRY